MSRVLDSERCGLNWESLYPAWSPYDGNGSTSSNQIGTTALRALTPWYVSRYTPYSYMFPFVTDSQQTDCYLPRALRMATRSITLPLFTDLADLPLDFLHFHRTPIGLLAVKGERHIPSTASGICQQIFVQRQLRAACGP